MSSNDFCFARSLDGYWRGMKALLLIVLLTVATACASGLTFHSFSFDNVRDSPGETVLDYRYGDSRISATRADSTGSGPRGGTNVTGEMRRGDSLYVKWRVKQTGKVYEETVDLKSLLPRNIEDHRIHFVVQGQQLFVYLVTPQKRQADEPMNGPSVYSRSSKVITLSSDFGREVSGTN